MCWTLAERQLVVAVNYAPHWAQCYAPLDPPAGRAARWLVGRIGDARYERDAESLRQPGLYLDMPPWGYHAFEVQSPAQ